MDKILDRIATCNDCKFQEKSHKRWCTIAPIVRIDRLDGIIFNMASCYFRNRDFKCPFFQVKVSFWTKVKNWFK